MGELQFGTRDERRIGSEPDVIRADPLCQELTPLCLFLNSNRMGGARRITVAFAGRAAAWSAPAPPVSWARTISSP